ncbi:MAG: C-GCAxxG-C-C family protein [bacterium]
MTKPELAAEYMKSGYNCAQSIVKAFAADAGITNEDELIKMAAPFGGGIGRNGFVCGALTGAALIIGKMYGNKEPSDLEGREKAYEAVNKLLDEFKMKHKSLLCKDLISIDMRNEKELTKAKEEGVFQTQCPVFLMTAGILLEKTLNGRKNFE